MIRVKLNILVLFMLVSCFSAPTVVSAIIDTPPLQPQAIPYQAGFPVSTNGTIELSSPVVVDLNGDNKKEVLIGDGAGCVLGWNSAGKSLTGFPLTTVGTSCNTPRIMSSPAVGDINGDGVMEIVAGTRGLSINAGQRGKVYVWRADTHSLLPGWPKEMAWYPTDSEIPEVYSVVLADVAGDSKLEVIAGTSNNGGGSTNINLNPPNLYVWNSAGQILPGYPVGYRTAGIYGAVGAANITGSGLAEVITGRDHLYLHAYDQAGKFLSGWPIHTYLDPAKTTWGKDKYVEFTHNAPSMADLDGDGTVEVVIVGKVRDPLQTLDPIASAVMVVEPNGQRRVGWETGKLGGPPRWGTSDWYRPSEAPVLVDLNKDGKLEIVVTMFDGMLRAFKENGQPMWSFDYAKGKTLYGSEPAVGDVNGDGNVDIVFGTYSPDASADASAGLYIINLNASGSIVGTPTLLPFDQERNTGKKGLRAAPTLTDLDGDGDIEILAGTRGGKLYVWDLPGLCNSALVPWPTGRQNNYRTGSYYDPSVQSGSTSGVGLTDYVINATYKVFLPIILAVEPTNGTNVCD